MSSIRIRLFYASMLVAGSACGGEISFDSESSAIITPTQPFFVLPNPVTVDFSGLPPQQGASPHWAVLSPIGSAAPTRATCQHCADIPTPPQTSLMLSTTAPSLGAGYFVVRIFANGGTSLLQQSVPIELRTSAPATGPAISAPDQIRPGQDYVVSFSGFDSAQSNNWFALHRLRPDASTLVSPTYHRWSWAGDAVPHNLASGTSVVDLITGGQHDTTGLAAGYYEVRGLYNNQTTPIRASRRVVVSDATLAVSGLLLQGQPVDVSYSGFPGTGSDWIGIANANAPDDSNLCTLYTPSAVSSGTVRFSPCPLVPGDYEARAYFNWNGTGGILGYQVKALTRFSIKPTSADSRIVRTGGTQDGITFIDPPLICGGVTQPRFPYSASQPSRCRTGVFLDRAEVWADDESIRVLCVYPTPGAQAFVRASIGVTGQPTPLDLASAADSTNHSRIISFVINTVGLATGSYTVSCDSLSSTGSSLPAMSRTIQVTGRSRLAEAAPVPENGIPSAGIPIEPTTTSGFTQPWGVTMGVPLPVGAVRNVDEVALIGTPPSGPAQVVLSDRVVRARWSAGSRGSIQWLGLYFVAQPGWSYSLRRRTSLDVEPTTQALASGGATVTVNGQRLRFEVRSGASFAGLENLAHDLDGNGTFDTLGRAGATSDRPYLTLNGVGAATLVPDAVEILENGAAHAVIRIRGPYVNGSTNHHEAEIYLYAFRELPYVRVQHHTTFVAHPGDLVDPPTTSPRIADVGFPIPIGSSVNSATFGREIGGTASSASFTVNASAGAFVHQLRGDAFRYGATNGNPAYTTGRALGWARAQRTGGTSFVDVALADIVERYPREIEVESTRVVVHGWPERGVTDAFASTALTADQFQHLRFAHQGTELNMDPGSIYSVPALTTLGWTPYTSTVVADVGAYLENADARGMTISTEFIVLPSVSASTTQISDLNNLRQSGFDFRASTAWNRASTALGDLSTPPSAEWLTDIDYVLASALPAYQRAINRGGQTPGRSYGSVDPAGTQQGEDDYGMWTYGGMHNSWSMEADQTELYRVFQHSHYQNVSLAWLFYFRSGDQASLLTARASGDLYATRGFRARGPAEGEMLHVEGPYPWNVLTHSDTAAHWADATAFAYRYLITGDLRSRELLDRWAAAVRRTLPPHDPNIDRDGGPGFINDWISFYRARSEDLPEGALALWYISSLADGNTSLGSTTPGLLSAPLRATPAGTCRATPSSGTDGWGWWEEVCNALGSSDPPVPFSNCFEGCAPPLSDEEVASAQGLVRAGIWNSRFRFHKDWLRPYFALTHDPRALSRATQFLRDVAELDAHPVAAGTPTEIVSFLALGDAEYGSGYADRDTALIARFMARARAVVYDDSHIMYRNPVGADRYEGSGPWFVPSSLHVLHGAARMLPAIRVNGTMPSQAEIPVMPDLGSIPGGPTIWYPSRPAPGADPVRVRVAGGAGSRQVVLRRVAPGLSEEANWDLYGPAAAPFPYLDIAALPFSAPFTSAAPINFVVVGPGYVPTHVQADIVPGSAEALVLSPPAALVQWPGVSAGRPLGQAPSDGSDYDNYPYYTYHAAYRQRHYMRVTQSGTVLGVYGQMGATNDHGADPNIALRNRNLAFSSYVEVSTTGGTRLEARSCRTPNGPIGTRHWLLFDAANVNDQEVCYDLSPGDYIIYTYGWYGPELVPTQTVYWGDSSASLDAVLPP